MKLISRNEEIILLAILKLGDNAYGVSIRRQIMEDTGSGWSFASIYQPLYKMVKKQYLRKIKGRPTAERGGKSKYYYHLTDDGRRALLAVQDAHDKVWSGVKRIAFEKEG